MAVAFLVIVLLALPSVVLGDGVLLLPKTAFGPHELGLIVNDSDPLSRKIARFYQKRRKIPEQNVIHVRFVPGRPTLDPSEFKDVFEVVRAKTPAHIQAFALAWTRPYKVGCMSITSAFATGYDQHYCAKVTPGKPCGISGASAYFASSSSTPYQDFRIRPTMMLAGASMADAKRLIDRGVASDGSFPAGTAYLLSTSDKNRSVRDTAFASTRRALNSMISVEVLEQDSIRDKDDVLFYFTGTTRVKHLDSLTFLPGAVADHLTSSGGHMKDREQGGQMSSLRWLEAGASGSYGTVIEPCNYTFKFSNPGLLMSFYLKGESLVEAYWKSVSWPGEGLFIGEPLAAPFFSSHSEFTGNSVSFKQNQFQPGTYVLEMADYPVGPYRDAGRTFRIDGSMREQRIDGLRRSYYRLEKTKAADVPMRLFH